MVFLRLNIIEASHHPFGAAYDALAVFLLAGDKGWVQTVDVRGIVAVGLEVLGEDVLRDAVVGEEDYEPIEVQYRNEQAKKIGATSVTPIPYKDGGLLLSRIALQYHRRRRA